MDQKTPKTAYQTTMTKRLASFGGPSAPTSSPVTSQSTPTKSGGKKKPTPASPNPRSPRSKLDVSGSGAALPALRKAKVQESEIQRLVRTTLKRASVELANWENYGARIGLQGAKSMVDQVTELDNALGSLSVPEVQPRFRLVTGKLRNISDEREVVRCTVMIMSRDFTKLVKRANKLEDALAEFVQTYGVEAAEQTPLWADKTWSLEQYVIHMHKILRLLNRFQNTVQVLSEKIVAYGLSGGFNSDDICLPESERPASGREAAIPTFEETRGAMVLWAAEAKAAEELIKEWNEMCALEVVGWDRKLEPEISSSDEDEDDITD
ncbi:unnamed protein product [Rhizoctonia solani]|uniref:Uncharacterized protein n=1 Tax=Rhizoctonia solani TaxID=456999 RepID=A0A8H3GDX1_9AGAM|nr:unnamed protein product [Rhizoctonia solani]